MIRLEKYNHLIKIKNAIFRFCHRYTRATTWNPMQLTLARTRNLIVSLLRQGWFELQDLWYRHPYEFLIPSHELERLVLVVDSICPLHLAIPRLNRLDLGLVPQLPHLESFQRRIFKLKNE